MKSIEIEKNRDCRRGNPALPERRKRHIRAMFYQFINPRRRNEGRRDDDFHGYMVDFHEPMLLVVVLLIMLFCVIDIYATLTLLERGGVELNPFMDRLIKHDVWLFFLLKYGATAGCLAVLLTFRKFRIYRGFSGLGTLYGILIIYGILVAYEIRLLVVSY